MASEVDRRLKARHWHVSRCGLLWRSPRRYTEPPGYRLPCWPQWMPLFRSNNRRCFVRIAARNRCSGIASAQRPVRFRIVLRNCTKTQSFVTSPLKITHQIVVIRTMAVTPYSAGTDASRVSTNCRSQLREDSLTLPLAGGKQQDNRNQFEHLLLVERGRILQWEKYCKSSLQKNRSHVLSKNLMVPLPIIRTGCCR